MIPLSLARIADVVGGHTASPDVVVTGAAFLDSRAVEVGGLFVALVGARVDGHDHADTAVTGGAAAVLCSRPLTVPSVVVADVQQAMESLARYVLDTVRPTVVALTGSQGKTTVKDLLAHLLAGERRVVATRGNHNNELGVPLTVLRTQDDTEVLVVEMGARGIGHIAHLCTIAPPHVAAVLNVGSAHLSEFGSQAAIAQAKGEIVEALGPDGVAVLNADDELVTAMSSRTTARVSRFGRAADGSDDVRLVDVVLQADATPLVTLSYPGRFDTVQLPLLGAHQGLNLAAAIALARAAGVADPLRHLDGLEAVSGGRMQVHRTVDNIMVIDDAYNANPESTRAGLDALAALDVTRRVAVLGEMLELGAEAADAHRAIGRYAGSLRLDRIIAIGPAGRWIAEGVGDAADVVSDTSAAIELLSGWLSPGDAVLVKASRGAALERVVRGLLSLERHTSL